MRVLSCLALLLSSLAQAGQIEDAARALAAKIALRLTAQERVHLVARNISALPAADAARARSIMEAALVKRPRTKTMLEVALTFSQNAAGYLWVAEIHKGEVEMVAVTARASPSPARQLLTSRLLWQQDEPLLDFVQQGDQMVILSLGSVAVVQAGHRVDVSIDVPRVRDPRGRLEVEGNALTVYLPGATCRGTADPLHVECDNSSADFPLNGDKVRFTPGRNTLEGARADDERVDVCGGMKVTAPKESVIALLNKSGTTIDQAELPGLITALWPGAEGAVVIIHNLNAEQYAAYAISVDCSSH